MKILGVLRSQFSIEVLAEKAWRKMSVRVKLKNLTTDIVQMDFNHVVPLIQVPCDTQKSKNGLQVRYMYAKKCHNIGYFRHFSTHMDCTCNPFLDFWVSQGTWISGTTWLKPIWIISVVKILSFTLTNIFRPTGGFDSFLLTKTTRIDAYNKSS